MATLGLAALLNAERWAWLEHMVVHGQERRAAVGGSLNLIVYSWPLPLGFRPQNEAKASQPACNDQAGKYAAVDSYHEPVNE